MSGDDMTVRTAKKSDYDKIAVLLNEYAKPPYNEPWKKSDAVDTLNYYAEVGKLLVAVIDKLIVGVVIFRIEFYNGEKKVMIEELIVGSNHQNKGIGKELMLAVEDYCKLNGIPYIWLITNIKANAYKFYKAVGYVNDKDTVFFSKRLI
ncbi:hypothetical protein COU61_01225 [Candidatus Pacearchaeota archaeon CG10_big_fil_rev_8_21_14_0_10_35_13]|nr:MAG: hypothetical protein COU61_01225 [Candidatus Pacearchaeota archaeon CG10_big_fil_rev_8_21_14_0_10_35_13]